MFYTIIRVNQASSNTKKDSSKSLYGGTLSTTSKSHLRPRGRTMIEQVKESQKTQSFPLNSNWKIGGI
jgi:hypothetical protein